MNISLYIFIYLYTHILYITTSSLETPSLAVVLSNSYCNQTAYQVQSTEDYN